MRPLNAVARGDLRRRLGPGKAMTVITVYLGLLGLLAFLSLPPDLGRLDELRQEGLLPAFLVVEAVLTAYLTSAAAAGEIVVEGEKSAQDLAASPFPARQIATGKLLTSFLYAALLWLLAAPFAVLVAGIRGEPLVAVVRSAAVIVPAAGALGTLGSLYAAVFESEFARSFVHWAVLLAAVVGAAALPAPWDLASPVRSVVAAAREGLSAGVLAVAAGYLLAAAAASAATARRVDRIRRLYRR